MKNSMKVLIATVIISLYGMGLRAESGNTGIYLTEQDYKSHKLSYVLGEHDKLRLNELLGGRNVSLTYEGKKVTLSKNEIFGYRLNNQDFRFYQNESYKILDTPGFLLYSRQKLSQGTKGYIPTEKYFYSIDTRQPVEELTMQNLSYSFAGETSFRYSLQSNFSKDVDLISYDKFAGQYKIKYLFFHQKQQATTHATL